MVMTQEVVTKAGDKVVAKDDGSVVVLVSTDSTRMMYSAGGAALGGAAALSFGLGVPFVDALTAMAGGLGAAVGVGLAPYVINQIGMSSLDTANMLIPASAFVVPALMAMTVDMPVIYVGVGGAAGAYLAVNYMGSSSK